MNRHLLVPLLILVCGCPATLRMVSGPPTVRFVYGCCTWPPTASKPVVKRLYSILAFLQAVTNSYFHHVYDTAAAPVYFAVTDRPAKLTQLSQIGGFDYDCL